MYHHSPGQFFFGERLMLLSVGFPSGCVFLPRDEFTGLQGWLPEFESVSGKGPGASIVTHIHISCPSSSCCSGSWPHCPSPVRPVVSKWGCGAIVFP